MSVASTVTSKLGIAERDGRQHKQGTSKLGVDESSELISDKQVE
jgi:hypothetical protein